MSNTTVNPSLKYVAEIKNVKEVMLLGTVDLAFWQRYLKDENLFPYEHDGKAEFFISATKLKYNGIRFGELGFSIAVCNPDEPNQPTGFFLVHAFNTSRLFVFSERAFFRTPYYHGNVQVEDQIPASFKLSDGRETVFNAKMSGVVLCSRAEDELWQGPIFLPKNPKGPGGMFFAKLGGPTKTYPFSPSMDTLELKASSKADVLRWLGESKFTGKEWRIRNNAEHSRSKTYPRSS